jgi:hypothetical protein
LFSNNAFEESYTSWLWEGRRLSLATYTFPKVNLILPAYALFFGNTMDIYTTIQGLLVGNGEGNPIVANLLNTHGLTGSSSIRQE